MTSLALEQTLSMRVLLVLLVVLHAHLKSSIRFVSTERLRFSLRVMVVVTLEMRRKSLNVTVWKQLLMMLKRVLVHSGTEVLTYGSLLKRRISCETPVKVKSAILVCM